MIRYFVILFCVLLYTNAQGYSCSTSCTSNCSISFTNETVWENCNGTVPNGQSNATITSSDGINIELSITAIVALDSLSLILNDKDSAIVVDVSNDSSLTSNNFQITAPDAIGREITIYNNGIIEILESISFPTQEVALTNNGTLKLPYSTTSFWSISSSGTISSNNATINTQVLFMYEGVLSSTSVNVGAKLALCRFSSASLYSSNVVTDAPFIASGTVQLYGSSSLTFGSIVFFNNAIFNGGSIFNLGNIGGNATLNDVHFISSWYIGDFLNPTNLTFNNCSVQFADNSSMLILYSQGLQSIDVNFIGGTVQFSKTINVDIYPEQTSSADSIVLFTYSDQTQVIGLNATKFVVSIYTDFEKDTSQWNNYAVNIDNTLRRVTIDFAKGSSTDQYPDKKFYIILVSALSATVLVAFVTIIAFVKRRRSSTKEEKARLLY